MKRTLVNLLITILFAGAANVGFGQTYSVPGKLRISSLVHRTFPTYFNRDNRYQSLMTETFFPIGWSKDGKLAYYVEPVDEACGCYFAHLVIQDLRTDKIIWEFKYDQSTEADQNTGKMRGADTIRKLWKKNQRLFSGKLAENGIVAARFAMLGKTFASGGRRFTAKMTKTVGANPDGYEKRVNLYKVSLASASLGSKNVFTSEDHTKDEFWFMLDAGLIGVLKSPYEDRVAIIAVDVMRGYEGPPHTGEIRVVGADLTSGFAKTPR